MDKIFLSLSFSTKISRLYLFNKSIFGKYSLPIPARVATRDVSSDRYFRVSMEKIISSGACFIISTECVETKICFSWSFSTACLSWFSNSLCRLACKWASGSSNNRISIFELYRMLKILSHCKYPLPCVIISRGVYLLLGNTINSPSSWISFLS